MCLVLQGHRHVFQVRFDYSVMLFFFSVMVFHFVVVEDHVM